MDLDIDDELFGSREEREERGNQFEDWATDWYNTKGKRLQNYKSRKWQLAKGENVQKCEIKLDAQWQKYGHLSIEIAEKKPYSDLWVPSGIYARKDTVVYIQGNTKQCFAFKIISLWLAHKGGNLIEAEYPKVNPTVKKCYLPEAMANELDISNEAVWPC